MLQKDYSYVVVLCFIENFFQCTIVPTVNVFHTVENVVHKLFYLFVIQMFIVNLCCILLTAVFSGCYHIHKIFQFM